MWNFLEKLRALPERSRKMVALSSSAFITAILLVSWLVFPVPHFGTMSDEKKEGKNAKDLITPFSVVGGEFHKAFGDIKEKWVSLGGTAGILSAVSALKENSGKENAMSVEKEIQSTNVVPADEAFLNERNIASSTNEVVAATTTEA